MNKYILIIVFLIATPCYGEKHQDNGHIIHNRLLPVMLHKVVPPFKGVHKFKK